MFVFLFLKLFFIYLLLNLTCVVELTLPSSCVHNLILLPLRRTYKIFICKHYIYTFI